jgi:hypothetical protein
MHINSHTTVTADENTFDVRLTTYATTPVAADRSEYTYSVLCRGIVNSVECALWRLIPPIDITTDYAGGGTESSK